ncbi:5-oxoprolinase subunit PxpA [Hirschia litorea]|uniref:5-oxoprolinase subunit PxpA n=1 Tax=Hirschia litorea TaxID=1199156 RepID=A0ABW2IMA3_9PROT
MTRMIDLNADLGEGCGDDAGLMPYISSCNIACGGHAGDAESMAEAVMLAKLNNVRIGAHPSYPDRENFGRTSMTMRDIDLETNLLDQMSTLKKAAVHYGVPIVHVKPHGALYNDALTSEKLAWIVVCSAREIFPHAAIMGMPNSKLELVAKQQNRHFIREGFADRRYTDAGQLVPRVRDGAMIDSDLERCAQALALAEGELIQTDTGNTLSLNIDSICIHGDTPNAVQSARYIKRALEIASFTVQAHIHGTSTS